MADDMDANGVEVKDNVASNDTGGKQAEPDAIRMFVGQIPRHWTEEELTPLFQEYGDIHKLVILKDRASGMNRGCCFVTYCTRRSALEAQIALHGVRILPGVKHPVQMKPADNDPSKNAEERKLFIGMVSKKYSEEDLRQLFSEYGTIEECVILRDSQSNSRGCAFVQYSTRQSCINAIRGLNRSQVMEGCTNPLTVKFAETAKQKEMKKMGQTSATGFGGGKSFFGSGSMANQSGYFSGSSMPTSTFGNFSQPNFGNIQQNNSPVDVQNQLILLALTAVGQGPASAVGPMLSALGNIPNMSALNNVNNRHPQALQALSALVQPNQSQNTLAAAAVTIVNALSNASNPPPPLSFNTAQTGMTSGMPISTANSGLSQAMSMLTAASSGSGSSSSNVSNPMATILAAFQQTQMPPPPPVMPPQSSTMQATDSSFNAAVSAASNSFGTETNVSATPNQTSTGSTNLNLSGTGANIDLDSFTQAFLQGVSQYAQSQASNQLNNTAATVLKSPGGKQSEGPEGANLFIYHLPQEFTDAELTATFSPFGNIVSSKVFVDKQTQMSKCFGFVSYDNAISAQNAIQNMNGFTIGRKKLRVQLKRDNTKPY